MQKRFLILTGILPLLLLASFLPRSIAQNSLPASTPSLPLAAGSAAPLQPVSPDDAPSKPIRLALRTDTLPLTPSTGGQELSADQQEAIREIGGYLPSSCRTRLVNFIVRFNGTDKRGVAGKDTVIINGNVPIDEFRALLAHELLGHFMDLGCLQGTRASGASAFRDGQDIFSNDDPSVQFYAISWTTEKARRQGTTDADFVTGYAKADAFEDLAESVTFYILHREEFRRIAQTNAALAAKLRWIETVAYPASPDHGLSTYVWSTKQIPWDATKLAYVWR